MQVAVQLPMFNERAVCQAIIDCCAELEWPAQRLKIQVGSGRSSGGVEEAPWSRGKRYAPSTCPALRACCFLPSSLRPRCLFLSALPPLLILLTQPSNQPPC
jgi:hypothetical protein